MVILSGFLPSWLSQCKGKMKHNDNRFIEDLWKKTDWKKCFDRRLFLNTNTTEVGVCEMIKDLNEEFTTKKKKGGGGGGWGGSGGELKY